MARQFDALRKCCHTWEEAHQDSIGPTKLFQSREFQEPEYECEMTAWPVMAGTMEERKEAYIPVSMLMKYARLLSILNIDAIFAKSQKPKRVKILLGTPSEISLCPLSILLLIPYRNMHTRG